MNVDLDVNFDVHFLGRLVVTGIEPASDDKSTGSRVNFLSRRPLRSSAVKQEADNGTADS
jgi:hypothetical protein